MLLVDVSKDARLIMEDMDEYTRLTNIQEILEEEMQKAMDEGWPLIQQIEDNVPKEDPYKEQEIKEQFKSVRDRNLGVRKGLLKHNKNVKIFAKLVFGEENFGMTVAYKYISQDLVDESSVSGDDFTTLMNDSKVPDHVKNIISNLPKGATFRHDGEGKFGVNMTGLSQEEQDALIKKFQNGAGKDAVDNIFGGLKDVYHEQILRFPFFERVRMGINFVIKPELVKLRRWVTKKIKEEKEKD